jgi:hypothetical protein
VDHSTTSAVLAVAGDIRGFPRTLDPHVINNHWFWLQYGCLFGTAGAIAAKSAQQLVCCQETNIRRGGIVRPSGVTSAGVSLYSRSASIAGGLAFLRCGGASPPASTRSTKTHVAHRRIKIERVYRPYLMLRRLRVHRGPTVYSTVCEVYTSNTGYCCTAATYMLYCIYVLRSLIAKAVRKSASFSYWMCL